MDAPPTPGRCAVAAEVGAPPRRRRRPLWLEVTALVLLALMVAVAIRGLVVQAYSIPSQSMAGTLLSGDRVLVSPLVYRTRDVARGDVVVFDGRGSFLPAAGPADAEHPVVAAVRGLGQSLGLVPPGEHDIVKRVIGVGGDRVRCCDPAGRITVNGVPLDERGYLYPGDVPSTDRFDVVVPAGTLWLLGDHRSASADSRAHLGDPGGGFVPVRAVVGRVVAIAWPPSRAQLVDIPAAFAGLAAATPADGRAHDG